MNLKTALLYGSLAMLLSCGTTQPFYTVEQSENPILEAPYQETDIAYEVFLIGDCGKPNLKTQEPTLRLLENQLKESGEKSAVVFLGDNIYDFGLPAQTDVEARQEAEDRINESLNILKTYQGSPFFVPGNHDWNRSQEGGLKAVQREEAYIENYLDRGNVFIPDDACPGPQEIPLTDDLILVALDSEWYLNGHHEVDKATSPCEVIEKEPEYIQALKETLERNKNKKVLMVAHHPLLSTGTHGGYHPFKSHFFPLTDLNKKAWVPLPILGSVYVGWRKFLGHPQDMPHKIYQDYIEQMLATFEPYDNLIYANGHEHILQYFQKDGNHFITSGAGTKKSYARRGKDAQFTYGHKGFAKLIYGKDGKGFLEFWTAKDGGEEGILIYRQKIF